MLMIRSLDKIRILISLLSKKKLEEMVSFYHFLSTIFYMNKNMIDKESLFNILAVVRFQLASLFSKFSNYGSKLQTFYNLYFTYSSYEKGALLKHIETYNHNFNVE